MKDLTEQNIIEKSQKSNDFNNKMSEPLELILDQGEKIAKDLHFRLKDSEKLSKLISRIDKTKEEYYTQCKSFECVFTDQVIMQDIENYYKNPQKSIALKQELKAAHDELCQSKKRHELSINGYNEHAEFMIDNIVTFKINYHFCFNLASLKQVRAQSPL